MALKFSHLVPVNVLDSVNREVLEEKIVERKFEKELDRRSPADYIWEVRRNHSDGREARIMRIENKYIVRFTTKFPHKSYTHFLRDEFQPNTTDGAKQFDTIEEAKAAMADLEEHYKSQGIKVSRVQFLLKRPF